MQKLLLISILCLSFLTGCSHFGKDEHKDMKLYETYIDSVVNNHGIESTNIPFEYEMDVYRQKNGTYKYEINIYNPHVAMYDIQAIAVNLDMDMNTNIYPCIGLLGDDLDYQYNMIPYQARGEKGFIRMITLDAVSFKEQFTVNVMVTWKDSSLQNESRVFFNCNFAQKKETKQGKQKKQVN